MRPCKISCLQKACLASKPTQGGLKLYSVTSSLDTLWNLHDQDAIFQWMGTTPFFFGGGGGGRSFPTALGMNVSKHGSVLNLFLRRLDVRCLGRLCRCVLLLRWNFTNCSILHVFCAAIVCTNREKESKETLEEKQQQKPLQILTEFIWVFVEKGITWNTDIKQCTIQCYYSDRRYAKYLKGKDTDEWYYTTCSLVSLHPQQVVTPAMIRGQGSEVAK